MENERKEELLENATEFVIAICESRSNYELQTKTAQESPDGVKWYGDMTEMYDAVLIIRRILRDGRL